MAHCRFLASLGNDKKERVVVSGGPSQKEGVVAKGGLSLRSAQLPEEYHASTYNSPLLFVIESEARNLQCAVRVPRIYRSTTTSRSKAPLVTFVNRAMPPLGNSLRVSFSLHALVVSSCFHAVAAGLHVAPAPGMILAHIQEEPTAGWVTAIFD